MIPGMMGGGMMGPGVGMQPGYGTSAGMMPNMGGAGAAPGYGFNPNMP